jgi:catechol 2,3-dioxygenase-like lactoylglutathione lyase family enzyme
MDASLRFYRDLLGLEVSADLREEFAEGAEPRRVKRRAAYLRWGAGPDASFVVLDQQLTDEDHGQPPRLFQSGVHHFAFWVDDIRAIVGAMRAAGVEVQYDLTEGDGADTKGYGEPPGGRILTAFVRDPDGQWVQLDQRA